MGYNPNIPHLWVGYNPFTNHLLTSWDIQVTFGRLHLKPYYIQSGQGKKANLRCAQHQLLIGSWQDPYFIASEIISLRRISSPTPWKFNRSPLTKKSQKERLAFQPSFQGLSLLNFTGVQTAYILGCRRKLGSMVSKWVITPIHAPFTSRLKFANNFTSTSFPGHPRVPRALGLVTSGWSVSYVFIWGVDGLLCTWDLKSSEEIVGPQEIPWKHVGNAPDSLVNPWRIHGIGIFAYMKTHKNQPNCR